MKTVGNASLRFYSNQELIKELQYRKFSPAIFRFEEITVEHCYSGFMGHPLMIFIWSKDGVLLNTITKDNENRLWVSNGSKAKAKTEKELTKGERMYGALRRFLLNVFENL